MPSSWQVTDNSAASPARCSAALTAVPANARGKHTGRSVLRGRDALHVAAPLHRENGRIRPQIERRSGRRSRRSDARRTINAASLAGTKKTPAAFFCYVHGVIGTTITRDSPHRIPANFPYASELID